MLPTDAKARKDIPIYSGFIKYFPDAIAKVAELSRKGNDQHNPGKPLHWDRSKSGDELDALSRHLLDEAGGVPVDTDGVLHLTKCAWRAMAALQKAVEAKGIKANSGWHDWKGGEAPPCAVERQVEVELRDGSLLFARNANLFRWDWQDWARNADIVKWRLA